MVGNGILLPVVAQNQYLSSIEYMFTGTVPNNTLFVGSVGIANEQASMGKVQCLRCLQATLCVTLCVVAPHFSSVKGAQNRSYGAYHTILYKSMLWNLVHFTSHLLPNCVDRRPLGTPGRQVEHTYAMTIPQIPIQTSIHTTSMNSMLVHYQCVIPA